MISNYNRIFKESIKISLPQIGIKYIYLLIKNKNFDSKENIKEFSLNGLETFSKIFSNKVIEYNFLNFYKNNLTFKNLINIKFISSSSSIFLNNLIFKKNYTISNLIIQPIFIGIIHSSVFLISKPNETINFLKAYHPLIYNKIKNLIN